ncbi:hypothetical protein PoB_004743600 [Plakobranchus ocellatus]|uniref:Uncharacterized protein n=1 Tax=Plakobranchus ocellatus TaxID=259542 RepID=A0AAV4BKL2_9GAST|nr:hypothetical protein PoB_004743600 [Plakobranchus ocellatus]
MIPQGVNVNMINFWFSADGYDLPRRNHVPDQWNQERDWVMRPPRKPGRNVGGFLEHDMMATMSPSHNYDDDDDDDGNKQRMRSMP